MAEEKLEASDALVLLVHAYIKGAEHLGLDYTEDRIALNVAKSRWRNVSRQY